MCCTLALSSLSHSFSLSTPSLPLSARQAMWNAKWDEKKNWNKMLKNCVVFGIVRLLFLLLLLLLEKNFNSWHNLCSVATPSISPVHHPHLLSPHNKLVPQSVAGARVLLRRVGHLAERVHLNGRKFEKNWNLSLWYMKVDLFHAPHPALLFRLPSCKAQECVISLPPWPIPPTRGSLSATTAANGNHCSALSSPQPALLLRIFIFLGLNTVRQWLQFRYVIQMSSVPLAWVDQMSAKWD